MTTRHDLSGRTRQAEIYRNGAFGQKPLVPTNFSALEQAARERMGARSWAYIDGGAGSGGTMDANRAAFDKWAIVPRVLRDVSRRNLSIDLFGRRLPAPVLFAPVGAGALAYPDSDVHIGTAAAQLGLPYVLSNQGCSPMERTAAAMDDVCNGAPRWFQLYCSTDDRLVDSLIRRAERIGADALVVTLDTTLLGWRPQDLNIGSLPFARGEGIDQYTSDPTFNAIVRERVEAAAKTRAKPDVKLSWAALKTLLSIARNVPGSAIKNVTAAEPRAAVETFLDIYSRPSLSWDDITSLRDKTDLPLVLKGVLHPDDASRAVDLGVDGILVSNHGGRQIDGAIASIDALPDIVRAIDGRAKILLDSGIRSGADVFKALALGADAVCIGRPHIYGLALAGSAGARDVVADIVAELDLTLGLAGQTDVNALTPDILSRIA